MPTTHGTTLASPQGRPVSGAWRERLFGISADEVRFERRGFHGDVPGIRERLERAGTAFVDGYNSGLRHRGDAGALDDAIAAVDRDLHGFAHEGAAMSLAILDLLTPWRRSRWRAFADAHRPYIYLTLIGAGWAMARLHRKRVPRAVREADPILWPLVWDGYGFHQGFFQPAKYVRAQSRPRLPGYASHGFDQGLGRSLWFVEGASFARIAATIERFAASRRADLWSGAGIACAYAGGREHDAVAALADAAGEYRGNFAQGIAFAAKARVEAAHVTPATDLACSVVCGMTPDAVKRLVDDELPHSHPLTPDEPRYESWRRRVSTRLIA